METPVIYFHTDQTLDVDLSVEFRGGRFSEWYPQVSMSESGDKFAKVEGPRRLSWNGLSVSPDHDDILPTTLRGSHYFAARGVSSTPVRMPTADDTWEAEKFLFYRGLGDFEVPLVARIEGQRILVRNRCGWPIDQIMLFRRDGDRFYYDIACSIAGSGGCEFNLAETQWSDGLRLDDLKKILRGQGLYEDEAQSMVDTWRHDWFGPGLRLLYPVPREVTDEVLPLKHEPNPDEPDSGPGRSRGADHRGASIRDRQCRARSDDGRRGRPFDGRAQRSLRPPRSHRAQPARRPRA